MKKLMLFPFLLFVVFVSANNTTDVEYDVKILSKNKHFIQMYNDVFNLSFRIYKAKKVTEYEKYINNKASKSEIKDLLAACNFKSEAELRLFFRRIEANKRLLLNEKIFNVKGLNKSSLIKDALHLALQEKSITIFSSINNDCAYALFAELSVCAWSLGEC